MFERRILDLEEKPSVLHDSGFDALNVRNALTQAQKDLIESSRVLFAQVLDDVGKVVSRARESFAWTRLWLAAGCVGG